MSGSAYREALKQARQDYEQAKRRFVNAENEMGNAELEMANLRRTINALALVCGENPDAEPIGLTQIVRTAMATASKPLTLMQVRTAVEAQGFDWRTQSDPDASLSSVLRRLRDSGEVRHEILKYKSPAGSVIRRMPVWIGKNAVTAVPRPPSPIRTGGASGIAPSNLQELVLESIKKKQTSDG